MRKQGVPVGWRRSSQANRGRARDGSRQRNRSSPSKTPSGSACTCYSHVSDCRRSRAGGQGSDFLGARESARASMHVPHIDAKLAVSCARCVLSRSPRTNDARARSLCDVCAAGRWDSTGRVSGPAVSARAVSKRVHSPICISHETLKPSR